MELGVKGAAWPQSRQRITNDILILLPLMVYGLFHSMMLCIVPKASS